MDKLQSKHIKHFEIRIELRSDFSLVETFQDGSQLIHKKGLMVIVEASNTTLLNKKLKPNLKKFSTN